MIWNVKVCEKLYQANLKLEENSIVKTEKQIKGK